ncbi:MAG: PIN domain-containing protein [Spirochaetaceae bacterium]|jgi:predicted nucleic acid-binding protein|nr:PIN domain-containing protein [Spirochaetaceae bacterium]
MRIYLDHCAYNRPFDDQRNVRNQLETTAKLYIQSQIKLGIYELAWSYMSDFENSGNPNEVNKKSVQQWEHIAKYICKPSDNILTRGKEIEKHNIRPKDALHISCAIESQCDYFITTDKGLTNKIIDKIIIMNPINFVQVMEAKNDDGNGFES